MRLFITILLWALLGFGAAAQDQNSTGTDPAADANPILDIRDAQDVAIEDFLWLKRLIVVFANSPLDPLFQEQMELLAERPEDLIERDVVIIVDTDPGTPSDIRRELRPRGFSLVFVDKDGAVKLRKPSPWDVREISRSIDKTDLRQKELRDARENGS